MSTSNPENPQPVPDPNSVLVGAGNVPSASEAENVPVDSEVVNTPQAPAQTDPPVNTDDDDEFFIPGPTETTPPNPMLGKFSEHHARVHTVDTVFGYDEWLNDHNRPGPNADHNKLLESILSTEAVKIFSGADTIGADIGLLPNGLDMYASYVDNFGGYPALVRRFGVNFKGVLLSITIFGNPARCADVQGGAMSASHLPHWLDFVALKDGGQLPWVYTSASNMSNCNAFIGGRHVVRFSAHYGHGPHVCGPHTCGWPQADWTQWDDKGAQGQNLDRSVGTYLPHPTSSGVVQARGVFEARLTYDHDHGRMTVTPLPGQGVKRGNIKESAHWDIGVELGGSKFGHWSVRNLPVKQD